MFVEHERRDGVHEVHLEELGGRHLRERHAPAVEVAHVDLLQILIEAALRIECLAALQVLGEQRHLREHRALPDARATYRERFAGAELQ
jgi:inhibitor of KinA sporulation pathway (predicted exonuclease)